MTSTRVTMFCAGVLVGAALAMAAGMYTGQQDQFIRMAQGKVPPGVVNIARHACSDSGVFSIDRHDKLGSSPVFEIECNSGHHAYSADGYQFGESEYQMSGGKQ